MVKSKLNLLDFWPEYLAGIILVLALLLSLSTQNSLVALITTIFIAFVSARIFFVKRKEQPIAPFVLIISALIVGYLSGMLFMNRFLTLILYLISFFISYYLHDKKIIKTFKSKPFLK
jgi:4-hydroxybenzoate polyprenyltransferase